MSDYARKMSDDPLLAHPLSERFEEALAYAVGHHRSQRRKGTGIPYAAHLLAVAAIVLEMETSEDEAIAALLHDVIEDGGGVEAELEIGERFGPDVARIVRANSDSDTHPKPVWLDRKKAYVAGIATKQPDELRISIADKLHNARSLLADQRRDGNATFARFGGRQEGTLWYYRALVDAFMARREALGPRAQGVLSELDAIVAALESAAGDG